MQKVLLLNVLVTIASFFSSSLLFAQRQERYEFSEPHMGTTFKLIFYAHTDSIALRASKAAFCRIANLNKIMSNYDEKSELSQLSESSGKGKKVKVSPELWYVLRKAAKISRVTEGAFDVTVGPVTNLWRRARRQGEIPTAEMLLKAKQSVGYQNIKFYPFSRSVELLKANMKLDLGGIGAGYAVDESLEELKKFGIEAALVDGGGDIITGKAPIDAPGWTIAIEEVNNNGQIVSKDTLVHKTSVTTSGDIYQFIEYKGKRYSHIVDPSTGYGLTTQVTATTYAKKGIDADAWASALCVLGADKAKKIAKRIRHIEFYLTWKEGDDIKSLRSR